MERLNLSFGWSAVVIDQDGKTGNNKLFSFVTLGGALSLLIPAYTT